MRKVLFSIISILIINVTIYALTFTLPEKINISRDSVYLKDIFPEIDKEVFVTKSAKPGLTKKVSRHYLMTLLNRNFDNIEITGPKFIEIETQYQNLDKEQLKKNIHDSILSHLSFPRSDISISFRDINYETKLPRGKVRTEISFANKEDFKKSVVAYVSIYVNDKYFDRTYIRSDVRIWADVNIAKENIKWNESITPDKIITVKEEITDIPGEIIFTGLENYAAKRSIPAGTVLNSTMLKEKPIIFMGDKVKIISRINNVIVSLTGEARQNGYKDKDIRVLNPHTGKLLTCTVLDKNTVLVN